MLVQAVIFLGSLTLAQSVAAPPPMTAQQILTRMAANTAGLQTYEVPVQINARIREGITIPVAMTGMRYFQAPAEEALKMDTAPGIARTFQNVYASLGTPATWPQTYKITVCNSQIIDGRPIYELRAVYRHPSRVDHIMLDVDPATFDPIQARWYYTNGATIVMNVQEQVVDGKYRLPADESISVNFSQYRGDADVRYGDYMVNQTLPATVFARN